MRLITIATYSSYTRTTRTTRTTPNLKTPSPQNPNTPTPQHPNTLPACEAINGAGPRLGKTVHHTILVQQRVEPVHCAGIGARLAEQVRQRCPACLGGQSRGRGMGGGRRRRQYRYPYAYVCAYVCAYEYAYVYAYVYANVYSSHTHAPRSRLAVP